MFFDFKASASKHDVCVSSVGDREADFFAGFNHARVPFVKNRPIFRVWRCGATRTPVYFHKLEESFWDHVSGVL